MYIVKIEQAGQPDYYISGWTHRGYDRISETFATTERFQARTMERDQADAVAEAAQRNYRRAAIAVELA
jgi:hypothetical protein